MSYSAKLLATAVAHHQAGRAGEAEKIYRKILRVEPINGDALRLLGGLYLQINAPGRALEYLEKAARLRPTDAETLANYGYALRAVGRVHEAIAQYRRAIEVQPDYVQGMTNLASIYQETGQYVIAADIFRQALNRDPHNPTAHYNYANVLYVSGQLHTAQRHYEQALQLKPDYLEAMVNLGMTLSQLGKDDQSLRWLEVARSWFDKALKADPDNVVALNNLANVLRQAGRAQEAIPLYRRAIKLKPDYHEAAINLGTSLRDAGDLDGAIESCHYALKLQPNSADARINIGSFLQELARHEEAVHILTEALRLKPESTDGLWNKAISLLALGRYKEGLELHEVGLGVPHMRGEYPSPEKRWKGENFAGKTLLLWAEQGFGDTLQFIRYAEMAKTRGGRVIVLCPMPMRSLFANCPYIDALPEVVDEIDFEIHAPMMSLPYIFDTSVATIPAKVPYLFIGEEARKRWAGRLDDAKGFKIGLVWAGNPRAHLRNANRIDQRRSMNLEQLRPLFDVPGVTFCNLQMGDSAIAQIDRCGLRDRFIDPMKDVKNFEDTGALMEQLDLILSVDTSVVHLAGGLGRPVWILSRFDACWRWLQNRADSPWYPSARVFGQTVPGDWSEPVARIKGELEALLSRKAA